MASGPDTKLRVQELRVLVVEDEFLIAMEVEEFLSRTGFRVLGPAASVQAALGLLDQQTPDVAVLDVNLRGERVTPVAKVLLCRGVPFVLTSAYDRSDLDRTPELADVENVGKPIQEHKLLRALGRMTRLREELEP